MAAKDSYNGLDFFTILVRCAAYLCDCKISPCLLILSKTGLTCKYRRLTVIAGDSLTGRTRSRLNRAGRFIGKPIKRGDREVRPSACFRACCASM